MTVMEPPPIGVPSEPEFRAVCARLLETFHAKGPLVALDEFLTVLVGPDWQRESERDLPGSVTAMQRDAVTFFATDLPTLLTWKFGRKDAARITCPVLYVGGSDSGPWFAEVRGRMLQLLPHAQHTTVQGAGHLLALTHPAATAELVVDFLRRHPVGSNMNSNRSAKTAPVAAPPADVQLAKLAGRAHHGPTWGCPGACHPGHSGPMNASQQTADEVAERLFGSLLGTVEIMSVFLGDRLGWYRSLADDGPASAVELARRTGTQVRYAREWLEQQAVAGLLTVESDGAPDERRFAIPTSTAEVMTDPTSLAYLAPLGRMFGAVGPVLPQSPRGLPERRRRQLGRPRR